MRKSLLGTSIAILVLIGAPAAAFASPTHPTRHGPPNSTDVNHGSSKPDHPGKSHDPSKDHDVMYVMHGTLSGYVPYNSTSSSSSSTSSPACTASTTPLTPTASTTPGSITICVNEVNRDHTALTGLLTFPVGPNSRLIGSHTMTITNGDRGIVKIRAPRTINPATLVATLEKIDVFEIIDQTQKEQDRQNTQNQS